ncbi:hypothetical protein K1719_001588 [Acacia pycnantha]|nr:hypothetical protein K1719_001588 [Acacia pycnantha]
MGYPSSLLLLTSAFVLLSVSSTSATHIPELFTQCLEANSQNPIPFSTKFFTPHDNASFTSILESTAQNLRYLLPSLTKPAKFIFTPLEDSYVQAAVLCAKKLKIHMRVRSGGHDYEGLSIVSLIEKLFMIIDLAKLHAIQVDIANNTVWVEVGDTLGEVYYKISKKSPVHAFPAGVYPSVKKHMNWVRRFYDFMTPYVSGFPREAYVNYRDLDWGMSLFNGTSFLRWSTWGFKFFKDNFIRLVKMKSEVDLSNFLDMSRAFLHFRWKVSRIKQVNIFMRATLLTKSTGY